MKATYHMSTLEVSLWEYALASAPESLCCVQDRDGSGKTPVEGRSLEYLVSQEIGTICQVPL